MSDVAVTDVIVGGIMAGVTVTVLGVELLEESFVEVAVMLAVPAEIAVSTFVAALMDATDGLLEVNVQGPPSLPSLMVTVHDSVAVGPPTCMVAGTPVDATDKTVGFEGGGVLLPPPPPPQPAAHNEPSNNRANAILCLIHIPFENEYLQGTLMDASIAPGGAAKAQA